MRPGEGRRSTFSGRDRHRSQCGRHRQYRWGRPRGAAGAFARQQHPGTPLIRAVRLPSLLNDGLGSGEVVGGRSEADVRSRGTQLALKRTPWTAAQGGFKTFRLTPRHAVSTVGGGELGKSADDHALNKSGAIISVPLTLLSLPAVAQPEQRPVTDPAYAQPQQLTPSLPAAGSTYTALEQALRQSSSIQGLRMRQACEASCSPS